MAIGEKTETDLKADLQAIATDQNVLVMSFVAPDSIVRKSPIAYDYASITIEDLYQIESKITEMKDKGTLPKKLHLVIQTPGGSLDASVKIAKYLQAVFEEIEAYVPYEAASGGTILCLAANTIVMDINSDLTPIDPQVPHDGGRIAATSYEQAITYFAEKFPNQRPEELPIPYQQMGNKFNPITLQEMNKVVWDTMTVALGLLKKSQKPKTAAEKQVLYDIVFSLGKSDKPHSHVISIEEAREIGLNVTTDEDKIKLLGTYKKWVSGMLTRSETKHIVEVYCPEVKQQKDEKEGAKEDAKRE